jgi:polyisoprenoid-binding protein YceI
MKYKTKLVFCLLTVAVITLASCGYLIKPKIKTAMTQLEKGSYQIDSTHASVLFKVDHMGLSTFVGRFNRFDAQLEFDPANIAAAKLSAVIDITSVDVNNQNLEETLQGSSWFDTERYPQASFKTARVEVIDASTADFTGDLNFHGVTAPLTLRIKFNGGGNNMLTGSYTLGFSANTHFLRSVYGMSYLTPAIGDRVDIEIFAEFKQK